MCAPTFHASRAKGSRRREARPTKSRMPLSGLRSSSAHETTSVSTLRISCLHRPAGGHPYLVGAARLPVLPFSCAGRKVIHVTHVDHLHSAKTACLNEVNDSHRAYAMDREKFFKAVASHLWMKAQDAKLMFGMLITGPISELESAPEEDAEVRKLLEQSPAWAEFKALYEYAVEGKEPDDGPPISRDFYDDVAMPYVILTFPAEIRNVLMTAEARAVLDGGTRELPGDQPPRGLLTAQEVALLANMDLRSVRNAMNPKFADGLVVELHEGKTFIHRNDARRWLEGRRGFSPTRRGLPEASSSEVPLLVDPAIALHVTHLATKRGIPVSEVIRQALTKEAA